MTGIFHSGKNKAQKFEAAAAAESAAADAALGPPELRPDAVRKRNDAARTSLAESRRSGYASNLLTGGEGDTSVTPSARKYLLGL